MSQKCQQKLTRLRSHVRLRDGWRDTFQALKRMHSWIGETERILAAEWGEPKEVLTTAQVAQRFDRWVSDLAYDNDSSIFGPFVLLTHFLPVKNPLLLRRASF